MARRLFTLCSALSLLLCAAVCVMWVRSYLVPEDRFVGGWIISSDRGWLVLDNSPVVFSNQFQQLLDGMETKTPVPTGNPSSTPITIGKLPPPTVAEHRVSLPYPVLVGSTGALAGWWILDRRARMARDRRLRQSLCLRCGYDLRASKDYCPECGTPAKVTT